VFIDDDERTGETVETAHDRLIRHDPPPHKAGECSVRNELVYEPWFAMIHGEESGLGNALKEAPEGNTEDVGRVAEFEVGY
jgi:hypothetical protein